MRVQWYGQSAFCLDGEQTTVFIDPFGDLSGLAASGLKFEYPAIENVSAEVLLITHEHPDHNGIEAIAGEPAILRSTAGRLPSPIGEVLAIASEHDAAAGTEHGPNTIFVFDLEGTRVCHFGDFGQSSLRNEQAAAIGTPELLFLPVGGAPTIDAVRAAEIVERLNPRWVVPMHYRTPRLGFLETADAFLERTLNVHHASASSFETGELASAEGPLVVVPKAP
jgi:L-ascorbate metabolism protein UlaG (beta-lactamase superfamily)